MKSRVIFLTPPHHDMDVSSALRHGDMLVLWDNVPGGARSKRPSMIDFEPFTRQLLERLDEVGYDPEFDAIVATGSTLGLCLAFAALACRHERFRTLVYISHINTYAEKWYDNRWAEEATIVPKMR